MIKQWWGTIAAVLVGIALVLAGRKATKLHARAAAKDEVATNLLNSGISKSILKGKKLVESANKDKDRAIIAERQTRERLEVLSETDESIDDIADRFNSRRVRS